MERNQKRSMTGVGRSPAAATRRCHSSWSSIVEAQATWWTAPAPIAPGLLGRRVVRVEAAALLAARLPRVESPTGSNASVSSSAARLASGSRKRAHAVEALERELLRDLGMVGDERRVLRLDDGQLVLETLGIGEAEEALAALSADALLPEVEGVGRGDAPDDAVHHACAGAAAESRSGTRRT